MTKAVNQTNVTFRLIGAVLCATVAWSLAAVAQSDVTGILAKMPAQTTADGEACAAALVKLGPPAVKELSGMLLAPGAGDDANVQYALSGLAKYVTRSSAETEREAFAKAIIEALDTVQDKDVKAFLMTLLQEAGRDEAIAVLGKYLDDDRLCEPAASALVAIASPGAADLLCKAFGSATGPKRLSLINALGEIRCSTATGALVSLAANEEPLVRQTAWFALANIGDPAAIPAIKTAREKASSPTDQVKATMSYLRLAERLLEAGNKESCIEIARELIKPSDANRSNTTCAALTLLVKALDSSALDDLLAATDRDIELRGRALALAAAIPGEPATQRWVEKARQASPEIRADVLSMLAGRNDKAAIPFVLEALKDKEEVVRLAAAKTAARLAGAESVEPLIAVLQATEESSEIKALKELLLQLPGEAVTAAAAGALGTAPASSRKALLEVIAARRAKAHLEAVFAQTKSEDDAVRLAAIEALGNLTSENETSRLVDLLLSISSDVDRSAAQKVVVMAAKQALAAEERAVPILKVFDAASNTQKVALLPTLSGVAGTDALKAVVAAVKSDDASVKETAIRTLGDWPDAAALDDLLGVAKSEPDLTQEVVALRGLVRIVGSAELPPDEKLRRYMDAMAAAKRPEEQRLVLGGLAEVRTLPALQFVAGYLDTADVKAEAALAVVKIVCPRDKDDRGLVAAEVAEPLKKAGVLIEDAEMKKQIEAHLAQVGATQ